MNGFDLLLLAFKGIAIASLPIALIWVGRAPASGGDRLRRLAVVTAFLTFDLIVFGGFTRLTDSGLGCPDWPGCYAKANPFMAAHDIRDAESIMPYGPVSMGKAWIEMIHRYLAMAVGVLIIAMLAISVRRGWALRRDGAGKPAYPALALSLLGLVVLQGAFGAWTVTQKLQPIFVSVHLLLGMSLLGMLVWHALLLGHGSGAPRERTRDAVLHGPGMRVFAGLALFVLILQIALGGWVSANYAVLACTDFPTCQGVWVPRMDFSDGFHLWRELGRAADGSYLSVAALTAIHWTHRSFAGVVFVVLGLLAWWLRSAAGLARPAAVLAALLVAQCLTGLVNVVFAWPLVAAVLHNAGAAALLTTLVVINYRLPGRSQATRLSDTSPSAALTSRMSKLGRTAG
ncbi:MAG: COX15/CtaA family protein [Burkholderiaceae bacterium]